MTDGDSDNEAVHPDPIQFATSLPLAIRELLDADRTAAIVLALDGEVLSANETALELLGAESVAAMTVRSASCAVLRSILDHAPRGLVNGTTNGIWQGDIDYTDPAGEHRIFRATLATRHDSAFAGGGYIGLAAHDVTISRRTAANLRHRATHDSLTGLANRRQILATLARALGDQRGRPGHVAAIFVDFDRLKFVNDALGHQVGDRLLISAAQRLSHSIRPGDSVARIGGDEFLVVCANLAGATEALGLADRARRALTGSLRLRQLDVPLSVSVGVALSNDELLTDNDVSAASRLISNADTAMYEAKSAGRGCSVLFTAEMHSVARERAELASELARAIADRRLTVEYQPIFSTVTNQAVGAEALVRWEHPERGPIDPSTFISIAEEAGTIAQLGEFVLDQALLETRLWTERGVIGDDFAVHVNVSRVQLASSSFVNFVMATLRSHGVRPEQLVLEAREAALLGRSVDVDRSLQALRRLGVRTAIDNFGAGANTLSVLTDIGADILKLEGAFSLSTGSSDTDTRLVRAVVLLAHALGMRVVAQRVSDVEQLRHLRAAGCDAVQGNLLAPVGSADDLIMTISF
ncbi:MAG TPA: bifunctional diguanylate cyclase/phosphodiesterase [Ilumatobacteraceae bacterium]|nr:bifunctional diguanylate cyclase/phosphodiesterase [Ilumatobacteraceae bacterium]